MVTVLFVILLVFVSLLYGFMYLKQKHMIFFPEKLPSGYQFNLPRDTEERYFSVGGFKIHSLYFNAKDPRGVILYFHGNAGSLQGWSLAALELRDNTSWDVWIVDYPGYGKSEGTILSEAQLHSVAEAMWDELPEPKPKTVALGRSIGSGIAARLASEEAVAGLILETPYLSLKQLVAELVPWVPGFLLQFTFKSDKWVRDFKGPILILHGTRDEVIPYAHGFRLAEAAGDKGTLITIEGGQHNDLTLYDAYWSALKAFLEKL